MRTRDRSTVCTILFLAVSFLVSDKALVSAEHVARIEYRSTLTKILDEADFLEGESAYYCGISDFVISADGSKIAFQVTFPSRQDLYVMNRDGSNTTLINGSTGWPDADGGGTLEINQDGSRVFFIAFEETPDDDIYYYDTTSGTCVYALNAAITSPRKKYAINSAGTRIFLRHQANSDPTQKGLFYADAGGSATQILNYGQLPCEQTPDCGTWYNNLYFVGASGNGNRVIFTWDRKDGSGFSRAMWQSDIGGNFSQTPNESNKYVWDQGNPKLMRMVSDDAARALYIASDGTTDEISIVNLNTNQKTLLVQCDDIDYATLSADGSRARFLGQYYRHTLYNQDTKTFRDTIPSYIPVLNSGNTIRVSDLTEDNRCFLARLHSTADDLDKIVLVDMNPTDFSQAPNISKIQLSEPYLYHEGETEIRAYVHVSDAQGPLTVEWVKLLQLVEGRESIEYRRENPNWSNLGPLSFLTLYLHDDGTNGDQLAGDGIYTSPPISTRLSTQSAFFQKYSLPKRIALRAVACDSDDNYTIADAALLITDRPLSGITGIIQNLLLDD